MYQNTIVIGRLGADPVMKYTPDGKSVTTFSVAVSRQERTTWFRVSAWGKLAETCQAHLAKGRLIMVSGPVSVSAWKDQDGNPKATLELTADTIRFLDKAGQDEPTF